MRRLPRRLTALLAAAAVLPVAAPAPAARARVQPPLDVDAATSLTIPMCSSGVNVLAIPVEVLGPQNLGECAKGVLS
ncbi:hypothetical protein FXF51_34655 [Nonomuraea sp. PA05]|uniref:hypothetical protein n=1 Tax=Nonomuraea sp. PA05 TaxID=2604466 RepID=UPI0011D9AC22|nr:hypothetical protein [Nonomuraea sp. PA05]TYB59126.1 hypothetical protein FXF51_34655 [Nonomuraea sp. PA05]